MTILSRKEYTKRIRDNELIISPILSRKQLGISSIDLRVGNIVLMARARGLSHVDPHHYKSTKNEHDDIVGKRQKHERHELTFLQKFLLHPGTLALVPTLEWVKLPHDLQGLVTTRSTWAREGLNIATASFVEPNYEGIVTLELANLGQIPIALYPGLRIAQIAFCQMKGTTKPKIDESSQFRMAFEPSEGNIALHDGAFIPEDVH